MMDGMWERQAIESSASKFYLHSVIHSSDASTKGRHVVKLVVLSGSDHYWRAGAGPGPLVFATKLFVFVFASIRSRGFKNVNKQNKTFNLCV